MKQLLFLLLIVTLFIPVVATGAINLNLEYPSFGGLDIGGTDCSEESGNQCDQDLNAIVAWLYYLIIGISGFAAFVMIVWGGIQWISSAGSPARITDAKDRIQKALLGLLLVLGSFLILQIVNPELTIFKDPSLPGATSPLLTSRSDPLKSTNGDTTCLNDFKSGVQRVAASDPIENTGHIIPIEAGGSAVTVTSHCRHSYNAAGNDYEIGIDLGSSAGRTVVASLGGEITFIASNVTSNCWNNLSACEANGGVRDFGNYIEIQNDHGEKERYAHFATVLNDIAVGDTVTKGQPLGTVGNTGYSNGAHLHWTMVKNKYPSRNPFETGCDNDSSGYDSPCVENPPIFPPTSENHIVSNEDAAEIWPECFNEALDDAGPNQLEIKKCMQNKGAIIVETDDLPYTTCSGVCMMENNDNRSCRTSGCSDAWESMNPRTSSCQDGSSSWDYLHPKCSGIGLADGKADPNFCKQCSPDPGDFNSECRSCSNNYLKAAVDTDWAWQACFCN